MRSGVGVVEQGRAGRRKVRIKQQSGYAAFESGACGSRRTLKAVRVAAMHEAVERIEREKNVMELMVGKVSGLTCHKSSGPRRKVVQQGLQRNRKRGFCPLLFLQEGLMEYGFSSLAAVVAMVPKEDGWATRSSSSDQSAGQAKLQKRGTLLRWRRRCYVGLVGVGFGGAALLGDFS
jgi:hypothetical protein